ncbi:MAG: TIGR04423 family type III CRISPR-associated protein [Sulfurimonas sp.]|nr:TIGR04423 family type III CRISPR-associated protein [Sulfurimonas sp.]
MKTKQEVIEYINTKLVGYKGYVQFSHRPLNKDKDIFINKSIKIEDEDGFVFEAHFCSATESISIKQINDSWMTSKTDISNVDEKDIQTYISDIEKFDYKIKMAQIWEIEKDKLCEGMEVIKLKKVVFAGFVRGDKK